MNKKSGLWGDIPYYLYEALANAETGRMGKKFIRTKKAPKGGSSAYGPTQITKGLVDSSKAQGLFEGTGVENYVDRFQEQGAKFLKYGREPNKAGYEEKYDYGGEGDLTSPEDRKSYKQMSDILIRDAWEQAVKDNPSDPVDTFIRYWRYGKGESPKYSLDDKSTSSYYDRFKKAYRGMMFPQGGDMEDIAP